jgi:predicted lipoprotein
VNSDRQGLLARAGLTSACAALAIGVACSRTDHPVERFAGSNDAGGTGATPTPGAAGSSGSTAVTGGKPGTGGSSSGGSAGSGSGVAGGLGEAGSGSDVLQPPELDCGEAPVSSGAFTRAALRASAADCASYHYCRFEGASRWLAETVTSYGEEPSPAGLRTAQLAYNQAFSIWSVLEHFQFGPLSSNDKSAGKDEYQGQGLRERIYAWPLSVRCRVEDQLVNQKYQTDFPNVLVSARGLFALEYLLFYPGSDTSCVTTSVTAQKWANFSEDDLAARKLAYAQGLAQDVHARILDLQRRWAADGENYRQKLVDATGYPSEPDAMKVLGWALFYTEHEVKDLKLGVAAGVRAGDSGEPPEAPYANLGTEAVRANLRGFRAMYQGCGADGAGLGFDDWLVEGGYPDLAQEIVTAYENAQAAADAFPAWNQATPADFQALYATVKVLTDHLKNDLFGGNSPIGLALPPTISGDTD